VEDNVSAASSVIAIAYTELYAFYAGKGDLLKKLLRPNGGTPTPPPAPL